MFKLFDGNDSYGMITKVFHFLRLFFLLAIYFCVYSDNLIGVYFFKYHKLLGMVFFVIMVLNVVWRILNQCPKSKAASVIEHNVEYIVFFCIYLLLMVIPLLGLLAHYNYGNEVVFDIYHLEFVNNFVENVIVPGTPLLKEMLEKKGLTILEEDDDVIVAPNWLRIESEDAYVNPEDN